MCSVQCAVCSVKLTAINRVNWGGEEGVEVLGKSRVVAIKKSIKSDELGKLQRFLKIKITRRVVDGVCQIHMEEAKWY